MNEPFPLVALIVLAVALVVVVQTRLSSVHRRLDHLSRLEGKVDALLKHHGVRFDPLADVPAEVRAAIRDSRKVEAIRLYRQATGAGLAEAKDRVEELQRETGA